MDDAQCTIEDEINERLAKLESDESPAAHPVLEILYEHPRFPDVTWVSLPRVCRDCSQVTVELDFAHEFKPNELEAMRTRLHDGLLERLDELIADVPEEICRQLSLLVVEINPNDDRSWREEQARFEEVVGERFGRTSEA